MVPCKRLSGKRLVEVCPVLVDSAVARVSKREIGSPDPMTNAIWQVMGAIDLAGQALTVAQIARRMGLARQGVQRIVNDLVKLGMLGFETNIDHKRALLISISEAGHKTLTEVGNAQVTWVNKLAGGLGERRLKQALKVLEEVRQRSEQS